MWTRAEESSWSDTPLSKLRVLIHEVTESIVTSSIAVWLNNVPSSRRRMLSFAS